MGGPLAPCSNALTILFFGWACKDQLGAQFIKEVATYTISGQQVGPLADINKFKCCGGP